MFETILFMAVVLLLGAALCYWLSGRGPAGVCLACVLGGFGFLQSLMSPVLFLSFCLLALASLVCLGFRLRTRTYSLVAAGLIAAIVLLVGGSGMSEWQAARQRYPAESMSARLQPAAVEDRSEELHASAGHTVAAILLPDRALERLDRFEDEVAIRSDPYREESLRLMHASSVEQFASSPGFGVGRMVRRSPHRAAPRRFDEPLPQPAPASFVPYEPAPSATEEQPVPPLAAVDWSPSVARLEPALAELHLASAVDFVNPAGFGYLRDRDYVAGFVPHAFSEPPDLDRADPAAGDWNIDRIELVSLLLQDEPAVYVSEHLPRMQEIGSLSLRPLDEFELRSLERLRGGEDLVVGAAGRQVRALGSLRAAQQCAECHGVDRGTLLGAFSYRLRVAAPNAPAVRPDGPTL